MRRGERLTALLILINPASELGHSRPQALSVYQIEIHNLIEVRTSSRTNKILQPGPARSIVINIRLDGLQLVRVHSRSRVHTVHSTHSQTDFQGFDH